MKYSINYPIDQVHAECLNARDEVRRQYRDARRRLGLTTKENHDESPVR